MGLFSKTVCSICGEKTGMGSRPILDGNVCSTCRSKFSPYYRHYRNMTADEVREHLKYREMNLARLKQFRPTKMFLSPRNENEDISGGRIYVDENKKQFLVFGNNNYVARNVDLFDYSDFYSFSYSVEDYDYIYIHLKAFSKACNSIVELDFEWTLDYSEESENNRKESPEFQEAIRIIKDIERFFNSISNKTTNNTVDSADNNIAKSAVNVRCPNCGAITPVIGLTAECSFCGSSFAIKYNNTN